MSSDASGLPSIASTAPAATPCKRRDDEQGRRLHLDGHATSALPQLEPRAEDVVRVERRVGVHDTTVEAILIDAGRPGGILEGDRQASIGDRREPRRHQEVAHPVLPDGCRGHDHRPVADIGLQAPGRPGPDDPARAASAQLLEGHGRARAADAVGHDGDRHPAIRPTDAQVLPVARDLLGPLEPLPHRAGALWVTDDHHVRRKPGDRDAGERQNTLTGGAHGRHRGSSVGSAERQPVCHRPL